jgi:hypothetical protein
MATATITPQSYTPRPETRYTSPQQDRKNFATPQTSNKYVFDALILHFLLEPWQQAPLKILHKILWIIPLL